MLRILKYLSKAEIGQMLIALVTIVGQVFFDLKLPDSCQTSPRSSRRRAAR